MSRNNEAIGPAKTREHKAVKHVKPNAVDKTSVLVDNEGIDLGDQGKDKILV